MYTWGGGARGWGTWNQALAVSKSLEAQTLAMEGSLQTPRLPTWALGAAPIKDNKHVCCLWGVREGLSSAQHPCTSGNVFEQGWVCKKVGIQVKTIKGLMPKEGEISKVGVTW